VTAGADELSLEGGERVLWTGRPPLGGPCSLGLAAVLLVTMLLARLIGPRTPPSPSSS
jgi:hypothetical protein